MNSFVMMMSVALISGTVGVACAWLVVMKDFPAKRVLEWALLLPLAIPAYIGAYAFVDFWEYAGPFQTFLRDIFGWSSARDYWFPEVRSRMVAIVIIASSLYPYVYLLARAAYREQSNNAIEVSRALGCGPWASFFRVGLPLARPAIVAGTVVVMMETLNDFGTVEYFAVQTLTTGIFSAWLEGSNVGAAAQIACVVFVLILGLLLLERFSRRNIRVYQGANNNKKPSPVALTGTARYLALITCTVPVLIGFLMPFLIILNHAIGNFEQWHDPQVLAAVLTTLWVAGMAALITVIGATILIYGIRLSRAALPRLLLPATSIGYVAPGAVLGLGTLIVMARFDHWLADSLETLFGIDVGLLITGTSGAVIFAYCVRFFTLAYGSIDAGFGRVSPNLGMAARSLGYGPAAVLRYVHAPLLRTSVLTAILLVFVDSVKELPATLLLRPFGFNTLATHVYDFASLEDIKGAAVAALLIILVSTVAVFILAKASKGQN
ncbi:ABC transporter permease [Paramylibacter ulvae]|nr:iron ABC transporter permease [Amylibacter ulvae]